MTKRGLMISPFAAALLAAGASFAADHPGENGMSKPGELAKDGTC